MSLQLQSRTSPPATPTASPSSKDRPASTEQQAPQSTGRGALTKCWVLGAGVVSSLLLLWCLFIRLPLLEKPVVVHARPADAALDPSVQQQRAELLQQVESARMRLIENRDDFLASLSAIERQAVLHGWQVQTSIHPASEPMVDLEGVVRLPVSLSLTPLPGNGDTGSAFHRLIPVLESLRAADRKVEIVELNAQGKLDGIDVVSLKLEFWKQPSDEKMAPR